MAAAGSLLSGVTGRCRHNTVSSESRRQSWRSESCHPGTGPERDFELLPRLQSCALSCVLCSRHSGSGRRYNPVFSVYTAGWTYDALRYYSRTHCTLTGRQLLDHVLCLDLFPDLLSRLGDPVDTPLFAILRDQQVDQCPVAQAAERP